MQTLKKVFAPKEIKELINELTDIQTEHDNQAFDYVCRLIKKKIHNNYQAYIEEIRKGIPARHLIYLDIAYLSGDLIESGAYHLYRGVLNPIGMGQNLLNLYDNAVEELEDLGIFDTNMATVQKRAMREKITKVG